MKFFILSAFFTFLCTFNFASSIEEKSFTTFGSENGAYSFMDEHCDSNDNAIKELTSIEYGELNHKMPREVPLASGIEGKWTTTIDTDNGSYTFFAEYVVKDDTIKGKLSSSEGSVNIYDGKINSNGFEYKIDINNYQVKHIGKLVDGKLKIKSISDNGDYEFTMTRVKTE